MPNFRFKGPRDKVKHKAQSCNAANVVMIVGDPRTVVENFQSFSDSGPSVFSVLSTYFSFYHLFVLIIASIGSLQSTVSRGRTKLDQPFSY